MSSIKRNVLIVTLTIIIAIALFVIYYIFFFEHPPTKFNIGNLSYDTVKLTIDTELSAEVLIQPTVSEAEMANLDKTQSLYNKLQNEYKNGEYSIENPFIKIDPYDFNPLCAVVMFESDEPLAISYTVDGDVPYSLSIDGFKTSHEIPVICLYEDRANQVLITATDEKGNISNYTYEITTEPLPSAPFSAEITIPKDGDGYIMSLAFQGNARDYTYYLDTNGEVRFYLDEGFLVNIIFTEEGTILLNPYGITTKGLIEGYSNGIIEIDYLGRIIKYYKVPFEVHHSFEILPNNNLLIATSDDTVYIEDTVIEIDRESGEIVNEWDYKDYMDMNRVARIGVHSRSGDWIHINSVFYDEETNSLVASGRQQAIISIDKDTEEINWILSEDYGYSESDPAKDNLLISIDDDLEYPNGQHALSLTDDGNLLVFDNGNMRAGEDGESLLDSENYSRAVEYHIDTDNMTVEQVWQYGKELGTTYYSTFISSARILDSGNYLINFGAGNVNHDIEGAEPVQSTLITEVSPDTNKILFEMKLDSYNYNAIPLEFQESIEVHTYSPPAVLYDESYYPDQFEKTEYFPYGFKLFIEIDPNNYGIEGSPLFSEPLSIKYTLENKDTGAIYSDYIFNFSYYETIDLLYFSQIDYPEGKYTISFDLIAFDPDIEAVEDAETIESDIFVKTVSF